MRIHGINTLYIEELTQKLSKVFEEKTGKEIKYDGTFDMSEIIEFYGGIIEYSDICEKEYELKAYITKETGENDIAFKIVVDKNISDDLKKYGYGRWNMFIMKYFYHVIEFADKLEYMNDGDVIYPHVTKEEMDNMLKTIQKNKGDNKIYTLYGLIHFSSCDKLPLPIYVYSGKYYLCYSEDNLIINKFCELKDEFLLTKIISLDDCYYKGNNIKNTYKVGDEPVYIFSLDNDKYFISDKESFINFMSSYSTDDKNLQEEINKYNKTLKKTS